MLRLSSRVSVATCSLALCLAGCNPEPSTGGDGSVDAGSGGRDGTGGETGAGGSPGSGGRDGSGGRPGSGGRDGSGGRPGSGGRDGSGGRPGSGGIVGSGGAGGLGTIRFIGNITTRGQVRSDVAKYWNQITPENEGKWDAVQPSGPNSWNWGTLEKIYNYAQDNGIIFKQHVFIWGKQQPGWVNASNAETAVKNWMKEFCKKFPNTKLIDVVNEPPPHTTPGYIAGIGGSGASGWDWIVNAFKWAREACPNAILILNDYNTIEYKNEHDHFVDIVKKVKAAGAPIDAIGAQAHDAYKLSDATVQGFINNLAATGLPVYITEYDIDLADDAKQKQVMESQMKMFWDNENVKGITLWGYIVGSTWRTNTGLMKSDGTMRPAMKWLVDWMEDKR